MELQPEVLRPSESWKKLGDALGRRGIYTLYAGTTDLPVYHIVDQSYSHLIWSLPRESTLITCHDLEFWRRRNWRNGMMRTWIARSLLSARMIVTPSRVVASEVQSLAQEMGRDCPEVRVIHNSCGGEFRPRNPSQSEHREFHLVNISNSHWPRKNMRFLIELIGRLRKSISSLKVLHVGPSLPEDLQKLADENGASHALTIRSRLSSQQIVEAYQSADLYLQPSLYEGFGYPLLECVASGTPYLASQIPVFQELFPFEKAILPLDLEVWEKRCVELLGNAKERTELLQMQKRLQEVYRPQSQAKAYAEVYSELS